MAMPLPDYASNPGTVRHVSVTPSSSLDESSGTEIATITVNGTPTKLFAPKPASTGTPEVWTFEPIIGTSVTKTVLLGS